MRLHRFFGRGILKKPASLAGCPTGTRRRKTYPFAGVPCFAFYLFQKGRACMQTVTLGRTGITVNKNGFGALPIQRVSADYAGMLLRKAYNAGITYFDTARSYSDSEEKMPIKILRPCCWKLCLWVSISGFQWLC